MARHGLRVALVGMRSFPEPHSGAEAYGSALAAEFVRRGHEVWVFLADDGDGAPTEERIDGVRVRRVPFHGAGMLGRRNATAAVATVVRDRAIDVVHVVGDTDGLRMRSLRRRSKAALVATVHGHDEVGDRRRWLVGADRVIATTDALAVDLGQHTDAVIDMIPTGVSSGDTADADELLRRMGVGDDRYLLFVGDVDASGRVAGLVRAFASAPAAKLLLLAGRPTGASGADTPPSTAGTAGDSSVVYVPADLTRAELVALMSGAAAVITLGERERSVDLALLAAATGAPIVAPDLPALRATFGNDAGCTLVAPDDPVELTSALSEIVADERAALAAIARGDRLRTRHDWGHLADKVIGSHHRAIETRGRTRPEPSKPADRDVEERRSADRRRAPRMAADRRVGDRRS